MFLLLNQHYLCLILIDKEMIHSIPWNKRNVNIIIIHIIIFLVTINVKKILLNFYSDLIHGSQRIEWDSKQVDFHLKKQNKKTFPWEGNNVCTLYFVTTARTLSAKGSSFQKTHKTNRESNLKILQEAHGQKAFRTTKHHREVGHV